MPNTSCCVLSSIAGYCNILTSVQLTKATPDIMQKFEFFSVQQHMTLPGSIPSIVTSFRHIPILQSTLSSSYTEPEKKRKDYAFLRQCNEKPSSIPGCPGTQDHSNTAAQDPFLPLLALPPLQDTHLCFSVVIESLLMLRLTNSSV